MNGRLKNNCTTGETSKNYDNGRISESSMIDPQFRIHPTQTHHGLTKSTHPHHTLHHQIHHTELSELSGGVNNSSGNTLQIHTIPSQRRSLKSNVSLRISSPSEDQNQNSSAAAVSARDFSSGRMASFKRETKTAQTGTRLLPYFDIFWHILAFR